MKLLCSPLEVMLPFPPGEFSWTSAPIRSTPTDEKHINERKKIEDIKWELTRWLSMESDVKFISPKAMGWCCYAIGRPPDTHVEPLSALSLGIFWNAAAIGQTTHHSINNLHFFNGAGTQLAQRPCLLRNSLYLLARHLLGRPANSKHASLVHCSVNLHFDAATTDNTCENKGKGERKRKQHRETKSPNANAKEGDDGEATKVVTISCQSLVHR